MLYEMLAGMRPFRGGNDRVLIQSILHEEPEPIMKHAPDAPESLERIVDRLLRKDPEARYRGARDVVADLEGTLPSGARTSRAPPILRRRFASLTGVIVALALLAGAALWLNGGGEEPAPTATAQGVEKPSIAVLPLANLSTDSGDLALADGMTQELITILARNKELRVIGGTSVFAFRNTSADVRTIADSLRVSHVLEGAFQKIGSRLRMQVRLVDARDGTTRWSETYDREFEDVFAVQEEIARAVARELDVRLAGGGGSPPRLTRHHPRSIAAYEWYLRGIDAGFRQHHHQQGAEYFQRAIAADSTFAAAYAGLARMYTLMGARRDDRRERFAAAEHAARQALALDDSLAEAHEALGWVHVVQKDLLSAEAEFKRAILLDPRSHAHEGLAHLYLWTGRPADQLAEARLALENDPFPTRPSGRWRARSS